MTDDDRPAPPGDWLTDRDRWRRRIASAILVIGVALLVWYLSPPKARAFDPAIWKQANVQGDYRRVAMSQDLVRRAMAEHWDESRVRQELSLPSGQALDHLQIGMRSAFDGPYYLSFESDAQKTITRAAVRQD